MLLAGGVTVCYLNDKVALFTLNFGKPYLTVPAALMINYGLFCLFCKADKYASNAVMRFLIYFGKNSIIVLLTHKILIYGFRVIEQLLHMSAHSLNPVLGTVLAILLEIPVIYLFSKYLPFLFGKEKPKKE